PSVSFLIIRKKDTTISNKITVNGNADINDAVCRASKPPAINRTTAIAVIKIPQIIFTTSFGLKLPLAVILPQLYVAESAEVTSTVNIKKIAKTDHRFVIGALPKVWNSANAMHSLTV